MDDNTDQTSVGIFESANEAAWNIMAYEAWITKYGRPQEVAAKIRRDPEKYLAVLANKFGAVSGKKIANLMGSNGMKAVALALLGAQATVFDYSGGNQIYAQELAEYADVPLRYVLGNVVALPQAELTGDYDIAFAEMGILHYFTDLQPLFAAVGGLLKTGGIFVLRDFHPVSTKLIRSRGTTAKVRKHKVEGDYFSTDLIESDIALDKYLPGQETKKVFLRQWNLGEIISAVARSGLIIESLEEEPNLSSETYDKGIPKTFTLVARK